MINIKVLVITTILLTLGSHAISQCPVKDDSMLTYCVDIKKQTIKFYYKDEKKEPFRSFENLKTWLNKRNQKLIFAMNGGMYKTGNAPLGLFIDSGKVIAPLNTRSASSNFYLKPNGVFYITDNNMAGICVTGNFKTITHVKYATQSGPMLVIDGKIHHKFGKGSSNVNIRNGVGVLPNGEVMFVLSKGPVSFYDFAHFFLQSGCKNALYLDGAVSQMYLPGQNWQQFDGDFGVIIAEISAKSSR